MLVNCNVLGGLLKLPYNPESTRTIFSTRTCAAGCYECVNKIKRIRLFIRIDLCSFFVLRIILVEEIVMEEFVIEGGHPLHGEVTPSGNKNAALPLLAACLLTAEPV